jgi:amino acid permease
LEIQLKTAIRVVVVVVVVVVVSKELTQGADSCLSRSATTVEWIAKDSGAVRSVDANNKQQSILDDHALPQLWSGLPRIVFALFVSSARQTTINSCEGNCQGLRCRSFCRRNKQQSTLDDHALPQLWSGLPRIVFCFVRFVSSADNN